MTKKNLFFKRKEFTDSEINKPFYIYLGYYLDKVASDDGKGLNECRCPISLYFGKDEISIYYRKNNATVLKLFSLYVAEGNINQSMLAKKGYQRKAGQPVNSISWQLLRFRLIVELV